MNIDFNIRYPLDEEMKAFLSQCGSIYPEENGALSVEVNRQLYSSLCKLFTYPLPDGVTTSDETIRANGVSVPIRRYIPNHKSSDATVVYYHGGGFVVGDLESHHSICADLVAASGCELVAVDYRLSPESVHPAAFNDALAAFQAIDTGKTIVAGDSAGGTLAGAVSAATRESAQKPYGQVLIYPWLGGELCELAAYSINADAPGLTAKDLADYRELRTHSDQSLSDHTYYPLALSEYSGMPPCIAFAAEFDPLRDDAGEFVSRLKNAGVFAENHIESGLIHGYLRARRVSAKAAASFSKICQAVTTLAHR